MLTPGNRSTKLSLTLGAGLLALSLGNNLALAAGGHGGGGGRMGGVLRRALASLDLTADQKDKIKTIVAAEKPALQDLRAQMRTDARALKETADASPDNAAAVGTAFLKVRGDRQAMKAELTKLKTQIETVLTPDQKSKFEGALSALKQRRAFVAPGAMAGGE